jgi:ferrous iron transport protein A
VTSAEPIVLSELPAGYRGVVARVTGGRDLAARLAAMGLTAGTEIVVLQNLGFGPMLARVRDTRIALGRGQAGMVTVYECDSAAARPAPKPAAPR